VAPSSGQYERLKTQTFMRPSPARRAEDEGVHARAEKRQRAWSVREHDGSFSLNEVLSTTAPR